MVSRIDENIHAAVAEALRRRGLDVTTTHDANLGAATDETQLAFARQQGRELVTHAIDFLRLHAEGMSHSGIVFCNARRRTIRELVSAVLLLSATFSAEEFANRVEYV